MDRTATVVELSFEIKFVSLAVAVDESTDCSTLCTACCSVALASVWQCSFEMVELQESRSNSLLSCEEPAEYH